ncbi:hypothetical protein ACFYXS_28385 [Streptomyces sp. NPDC002574]|uniref:hypothetical protein n=1 Tax=Streptomyces sp. NPDC002574 TaxID=3364652 RepID=UPI003690E2A7
MNPEPTEIRNLMDAGDTAGAVRALRAHADSADPAALAPLVAALAGRSGSGDLAAAATALAAAPSGVAELYAYGYACVEEGAAYLAVPALRAALRQVPDSRRVLVELVAALEREERHREALDVLRERESALAAWPERYLLAHNALMAGESALAREAAARLPVPVGDDQKWLPADTRLRRRLGRAGAVAGTTALDGGDLRGWHWVLTGGVLATLSPYGFESMRGRYAYVQDSAGLCRGGLDRLRLALAATGAAPRAVAALPDRSSRIMGLAAARVLELPVEPYEPGRMDTVVVAYDLTGTDPGLLDGLREPAAGQVLYEHATCWTRPPAVSADISGLLAQHCVAPWGERLRMSPDGSPGVVPPDDRSEHDIAHEVVAADPMPDRGDGGTPSDPDAGFSAFAARLAGRWPDGDGLRERTASAGPVGSARFV